MDKLIYADVCNEKTEENIKRELGLIVVRQQPEITWNMQEASKTLTDPAIVLAVFSRLSEVSIIESGLLMFLCKPLLIADSRAREYDLISKQADYVDSTCNLRQEANSFITWYKYTMGII
jgi:hypothetical protein